MPCILKMSCLALDEKKKERKCDLFALFAKRVEVEREQEFIGLLWPELGT